MYTRIVSFCFLRAAFLGVLMAFVVSVAHAMPAIQHWITPEGTRVYFVESHTLPLVDIRIDFAAGSAADPEQKAGLASMTQSLLEAGAGKWDEQAIADRIADIGAAIGGSVELDRSSLVLRTLSSAPERDAAVDLAAVLLASPNFPVDVLERERTRGLASLKEAMTRPAFLADRQFNQSIYGAHPYGRQTTSESLKAMTRDDLVAFHRDHYTAQAASIAIVGDVTRKEAEQIALRLTQDLPAGVMPSMMSQPEMPTAALIRIPHPSAQAHILVGQLGMSREDPDYFPLLVGNHILGGGGFTSRLVKEVREKRGYAYSIYSYFQPQQVPGPFQIGLQTRGSQIDDALKVVGQTLDAFIATGPTTAELQAAKDNIINGFGLRLDSNRKILEYVATVGFYALPLDWLETYPKSVAAVTAEQIQQAFSRRIRPENRITVVVGGEGDTGTVNTEQKKDNHIAPTSSSAAE